MELVEGAQVRLHVGVGVPRLGDHHQHGVLDAAARHRRAARGRCRTGSSPTRPCRARPGAWRRRCRTEGSATSTPRAHPVGVAPEGVDLPVVRDHPERLGQVPAGEDVGGEARMEHAQARPDALVAEVGVEGAQLGRGEHPLVDEGPARQRGHVHLVAQVARCRTARLEHPSHDVEPPLEVRTGEAHRGEEELSDPRHPRPREGSELAHLEGDVAPSEEPEALVVAHLVDERP